MRNDAPTSLVSFRAQSEVAASPSEPPVDVSGCEEGMRGGSND